MVMAVFDLCDTLVRENTTVGFLKWISREHPQVDRALSRWLGNPLFFVVGSVMQRLGRDLARERLVRSLKGMTEEQLNAAAVAYAEWLISQRGNEAILARLEAHRQAGHRIIILSSSLDPVVKAVAAALGGEGLGSTLGAGPDGRCAGRIVRDLTGRKAMAAAALRQEGERLVVYTDNRTDLELLRSADERVVILPHGRGNERWAGEDCTYVAL